MNALDYQRWVTRAFLYVEAALATELASPKQLCMTEEYVRSAFVRGLLHSLPLQAHRVTTELSARWSGNLCENCAEAPGGRSVQHDVAVLTDGVDAGLVCEVKWLKHRDAAALGRDIWKLALTRSIAAEGHAMRCYLLIGGEADALSDTLRSLRLHGVDLRWSNAGMGAEARASRDLSLRRFLRSQLGSQCLKHQLTWGEKKHIHLRMPVTMWRMLRVSRRGNPWLRTIDGVGWRAVLFEIHHHGAADDIHLDDSRFIGDIKYTC